MTRNSRQAPYRDRAATSLRSGHFRPISSTQHDHTDCAATLCASPPRLLESAWSRTNIANSKCHRDQLWAIRNRAHRVWQNPASFRPCSLVSLPLLWPFQRFLLGREARLGQSCSIAQPAGRYSFPCRQSWLAMAMALAMRQHRRRRRTKLQIRGQSLRSTQHGPLCQSRWQLGDGP